MPRPEAEAASALAAAAGEDLSVVRELLGNERIGDRVIGFHAQQAVEKLIKAVLAARGVDYPFTHDVARLLDELERTSLPDSLPLEPAEDLTPWATELRYGGAAESSLDREATLRVVEAFRDWAVAELSAGP